MIEIIHPSERVLNWSPSRPDFRDWSAFDVLPRLGAMPPKFVPPSSTDLRSKFPPALDQLRLGTCVWNATAGATQYAMKREGSRVFLALPSRLFGYKNTRIYEGWPDQDIGCYVRDAFKSLNADGVCSEIEWPYIESQVNTRPTKICYTHALKEKAVRYGAVDNTQPDQIKTILSLGYPVIFGFTVYDSFLTQQVAESGLVPMPKPTESVQGGHSMLIVGHDDDMNIFRCRNSWGPGWGQSGFCTMPQQYLTNTDLAADFWVLTFVTK